MKPIKLKVNTKSQNYNIIIGNDLVSRVFNLAKNNSLNFRQCLLIIDKNISKKIISKIKKSLIKKKVYVYLIFLNPDLLYVYDLLSNAQLYRQHQHFELLVQP